MQGVKQKVHLNSPKAASRDEGGVPNQGLKKGGAASPPHGNANQKYFLPTTFFNRNGQAPIVYSHLKTDAIKTPVSLNSTPLWDKHSNSAG